MALTTVETNPPSSKHDDDDDDVGYPLRTGVYAEKFVNTATEEKNRLLRLENQQQAGQNDATSTTIAGGDGNLVDNEGNSVEDSSSSSIVTPNKHHQKQIAERRLLTKNRRLATTDILAPSDTYISNLLTTKAEEYRVHNNGSMAPTYVSPTPMRTLYTIICQAMVGTEPNTQLLNLWNPIETNISISKLNLNGLYLGGKKGMCAVMYLLKECVNVTHVDFRNQYIGADALKILVHIVLPTHPSLTSLDLRVNYLEGESMRKLISVVGINPRLQEIIFDEECQVPLSMNTKIQNTLKKNQLIMKNVRPCKAVLNPLPSVLMAALKGMSVNVDVLNFERQMQEWRDD